MGNLSRVTILITHIRGLIALLITTPEPPSMLKTLRPAWSRLELLDEISQSELEPDSLTYGGPAPAFRI